MKALFGVLLIVIGVCAGLYFGLWWAFIGGIVALIEQVRAPNLDALMVAIAIARIVFTGLIAWVSAMIFVLPGFMLLRR